MTDNIYYAFDLGPGDGGKGGVVHKLSTHHQAHTVIKIGGAQGSHGVTTNRCNFAFSQWGCGTLEGTPTHITPLMVISPEGLLNEADGLRYVGITDAFDLLTIDEQAICSTPYHGITSRLKELSRQNNPRGTIGTGVGEAYRNHLSNPELTIYAKDLKTDLTNKLTKIRDHQIEATKYLRVFMSEDKTEAQTELNLLTDPNFLAYCIDRFKQAGKFANVVNPEYLKTKILPKNGNAVIESSHGILTDSVYGFAPHTSAIRTLPKFTHTYLREIGYDGRIVNVGVHRAYTVRHGAGPMPTASDTDNLLPGSHKAENRYQGKIRTGALDLVLLKYAVDVCGGPTAIDWLAITWFDQIVENGRWMVCDRYSNPSPEFFEDGNIRVTDETDRLTNQLFQCIPELTAKAIPDTRTLQYELCNELLFDKLHVPTKLVSFGPHDRDKTLR